MLSQECRIEKLQSESASEKLRKLEWSLPIALLVDSDSFIFRTGLIIFPRTKRFGGGALRRALCRGVFGVRQQSESRTWIPGSVDEDDRRDNNGEHSK